MNKKQSSVVVLVAIIAAALVVTSRMTTAPASASITGNDTTTPSSGLELSAQSVWVEHATITGVTPINETHSSITYSGNGTLCQILHRLSIPPAMVAHLSHLQQNRVKER